MRYILLIVLVSGCSFVYHSKNSVAAKNTSYLQYGVQNPMLIREMNMEINLWK